MVAADERAQVRGRALVVKRLRALPIEAVVRGYLIGSGWQDYQSTGGVCGIPLPPGLQLASRLPQAIFTPATKAAIGDHDENISFAAAQAACATTLADLLSSSGKTGAEIATQARDAAIALYTRAAEYAAERGIIIADTKFEFGLDEHGTIRVMDEILTPDSSRFWDASEYRVGISPPSFDKQFVRDYLESLGWNKTAPGPRVPADIIEGTRAKYAQALRLLTA